MWIWNLTYAAYIRIYGPPAVCPLQHPALNLSGHAVHFNCRHWWCCSKCTGPVAIHYLLFIVQFTRSLFGMEMSNLTQKLSWMVKQNLKAEDFFTVNSTASCSELRSASTWRYVHSLGAFKPPFLWLPILYFENAQLPQTPPYNICYYCRNPK